MKPYPEYKSTDLDWLPQVPAHWEVKPNVACFEERIERNVDGAELLAVTMGRGVIKQSEITAKKDSSNQDKSKYKRVCVGDIAYNKMRMWQGAAGKSDYDGIVSPAYIILKPKANVVPAFYHALFRTPLYQKQSYRSSYGICDDQLSLRYFDFKRLSVPVPPLDEQEQIVRYLGAKQREIERYIAAKRALLARLNELSAAVISRAVTRGLNAEVALKPSGVEWLDNHAGGIPKHWEVKKLSYCASLKSGDSITAQNIEEDSGEYAVYGGNGFRGYTTSFTHDGHYALIGRQGALCGNINYASGKFFASEHAVVVTPRSSALTSYLGELLRTMNLNQYSMTAAQPGLSVEVISKLKIPLPPLEEQKCIVEYIEEKLAVIAEARGRIEREIELARELNQTLVANVVTGAVDVSGIAVALDEQGEALDNAEGALDDEDGALDEALGMLDEE